MYMYRYAQSILPHDGNKVKIEESEHPNSFISSMRQDALSIRVRKPLRMGSFLTERISGRLLTEF